MVSSMVNSIENGRPHIMLYSMAKAVIISICASIHAILETKVLQTPDLCGMTPCQYSLIN